MQATLERKQSGGAPFLLMLIIVGAIGAGLFVLVKMPAPVATDEQNAEIILDNLAAIVYDPAYTHAPQEHPDTYQAVRKCVDDKGPYVTFQILPKKRYLHVCMIDDHTIGFMIVDLINKLQYERTAYVKDAMRSVNEVFAYARKVGYTRFTGKLP